jgi:hypothetical protein
MVDPGAFNCTLVLGFGASAWVEREVGIGLTLVLDEGGVGFVTLVLAGAALAADADLVAGAALGPLALVDFAGGALALVAVLATGLAGALGLGLSLAAITLILGVKPGMRRWLNKKPPAKPPSTLRATTHHRKTKFRIVPMGMNTALIQGY